MALIPEDRKTEGLMLPMTVGENLSFASLDRLSKAGVIDRAAERRAIDEMLRLLAIKTADTETTPVGALSGGNQQKVVIAKWLMNAPQIILLNDPTRGIDVGTKQEIYRLLRKLADDGAAILLYSTDYAELIGCCDRVLVLYDGAIRRELAGDDITEHALVASALNIAPADVARQHRGRASDERLALPVHRPHGDALGRRRLRRRSSRSTSPITRPASAPTWCRRPPTRACCWRSWPWPRPSWC